MIFLFLFSLDITSTLSPTDGRANAATLRILAQNVYGDVTFDGFWPLVVDANEKIPFGWNGSFGGDDQEADGFILTVDRSVMGDNSGVFMLERSGWSVDVDFTMHDFSILCADDYPALEAQYGAQKAWVGKAAIYIRSHAAPLGIYSGTITLERMEIRGTIGTVFSTAQWSDGYHLICDQLVLESHGKAPVGITFYAASVNNSVTVTNSTIAVKNVDDGHGVGIYIHPIIARRIEDCVFRSTSYDGIARSKSAVQYNGTSNNARPLFSIIRRCTADAKDGFNGKSAFLLNARAPENGAHEVTDCFVRGLTGAAVQARDAVVIDRCTFLDCGRGVQGYNTGSAQQQGVEYVIQHSVITALGGAALEVSGIGSEWVASDSVIAASGANLQGVIRTEGTNQVGGVHVTNCFVSADQAQHAFQINGEVDVYGGWIRGVVGRELIYVHPAFKGSIDGVVTQHCPPGTNYPLATDNVILGRIFELACQ